MKDYFVYMMSNRSRVVLYVGMTSRLDGRVMDHRSRLVEAFTSKHKLNRLVYYEQFSDPISAITREKEIKGWRRAKKNALVETLNPKWQDLTELLFGDVRKCPGRIGGAGTNIDNRPSTACVVPSASEGSHLR